MQLELLIPSNVDLDEKEQEMIIAYMSKCTKVRFLEDGEDGRIFIFDPTSMPEEKKLPDLPEKPGTLH